MTDKQIIIDGVDVSGCLFYQTNFEEDYDVKIKHYCSNWHNSCESNNNSNCYYKQLLRKEQELEQYKASKQASYEALQTKCNKLELENRKLKEENEELKKANDSILTTLNVIAKGNIKLRQTLTEIKEIATCCIEGDVARIRMKQILQKISEVLDEEI